MRELTAIIGIIFGVLSGLGMMLGIALKGFSENYGAILGGISIIVVLILLWGPPAAYYSVNRKNDDSVNAATIGFCIWINRIFLGLCVVGLSMVTVFK